MKNQITNIFIVLALFTIAACKKDPVITGSTALSYKLLLPKGFPEPEIPDDNPLTQEKIDLGKKLFNDKILSKDKTISCSSCHFEKYSFSDTATFSTGISGQKGGRNAPSLTNVIYGTSFFWDGGVPTLEQQVIAPIENPVEMDLNISDAVNRLQANPEYVQLFKNAFGTKPSIFSLVRAIACFERTLISGNSRFDQYMYSNNTTILTTSEMNGMNIFMGEKGECFHCHGEFTFTDNSFRNNGLYLNYADRGRGRITGKTSDDGKFKVPTLRNIEKTAPYMHDGSFKTLMDVVEHYNSGGKNHPNKSALIKPLNLTVQEKQDLVNFLKALTD